VFIKNSHVLQRSPVEIGVRVVILHVIAEMAVEPVRYLHRELASAAAGKLLQDIDGSWIGREFEPYPG